VTIRSNRRVGRAATPVTAAQRLNPRSDIGGEQVAYPAVNVIELPRCLGKAARPVVERLRLQPGHRITQGILVARGTDQLIGIESGKRLPLAFEHGNHLPQVCCQGCTIGRSGEGETIGHRFSPVPAATG
jgi:hypothetical protein